MTRLRGYAQARFITLPSLALLPSPAHVAITHSVAQVAYGTSSLLSPARAHLQHSAPSAPHVGRAAQAQKTSPERTPAVTPHDAVMRNELEGVLRGAKQQGRRQKSTERSSCGSGNSMVSSRNLSTESDLFFGANGEVSVTVTLLSSAESKTSSFSSHRCCTYLLARVIARTSHARPPSLLQYCL
ncbi:uncharacterized protein C8Q71DRAFT_891820 [Rhodofomes roseus]|uniref:Secreted protein n=1 Tax=Rhodofomes roseus TaxID=34475 RepID=A0ABQ8JY72_9APHY|nr:uncharacterized protein C8Q71DRAFT_891820 [Rhodofomes roseus]KAH9828834.1 hypothetical protein C8Q71DRAFT_891820 [Rhodofomes roseus]